MKKLLILPTLILLQSCASTPEAVTYNGESVRTYGTGAGCGTLNLDSDCSQMSGATKAIEIDGVELRVSGGNSGKVVFVMSKPKMLPDDAALSKGSKAIEELIQSKNIKVLETKVMYGSGKVFGVHYTLDGDAYRFLEELAI